MAKTPDDVGLIGRRYYSAARQVEIVGSYDGHGRDDPPGYYYKFIGETAVHWISATGAAVRFKKQEESNGNDAGTDSTSSPQNGET